MVCVLVGRWINVQQSAGWAPSLSCLFSLEQKARAELSQEFVLPAIIIEKASLISNPCTVRLRLLVHAYVLGHVLEYVRNTAAAKVCCRGEYFCFDRCPICVYYFMYSLSGM